MAAAAVPADQMKEWGSTAATAEVDLRDIEALVREQMIAAGIDPDTGLPLNEKLTSF